jgi:hypothetical protein
MWVSVSWLHRPTFAASTGKLNFSKKCIFKIDRLIIIKDG